MYLDTDILIALLFPDDHLHDFALEVLHHDERPYTSSLALVEIGFVFEKRMKGLPSARVLDELRTLIPHLEVLPLAEPVVSQGFALRETYGLTLFDSIHVATCLSRDAHIASSDRAFQRVQGLVVYAPKG